MPIIRLLILAAWTLWSLVSTLKYTAGRWGDLVAQAISIHPRLPSFPGLANALLVHLMLVSVSITYLALLVVTGGAVVRILRPGGRVERDLTAKSCLIGLAIVGNTVFGLALLGLAYTSAVAAALVMVAGFGTRRPFVASVVAEWRVAIAEMRPSVRWFDIPVGGLLFMIGVAALAPDCYVDVLTYHLGGPSQLMVLHKFSSFGSSIAHFHPLSVELAWLPSLLPNLRALPHLLNLALFLLMVKAIAGFARHEAGTEAGRLTWVLVGTSLLSGQLLLVAKNDVAAAAFCVFGLFELIEGTWNESASRQLLGSVLLWCGAAAKFNILALLAPAYLLSLAFTRFRASHLLHLAAASVTWIAWPLNSWLMTGDPLFPMLSGRLGAVAWTPQSTDAVRALRGEWKGLGSMVGGAWGAWRFHHFAASLLVLPALARWHRSGKRTGVVLAFCVAGTVLLNAAIPSQAGRMALPLDLLLAGLVAIGASSWLTGMSRSARSAILFAIGCAALVPLPLLFETGADWRATSAYLSGLESPRRFRELQLTTLDEVCETLRATAGARRLALMGDTRLYGLPLPCVTEHCWGESPAWKLAEECRDPSSIRRRLRQLGVSHLVQNVVTESFPATRHNSFGWNRRMLDVWIRFTSRYLTVVNRPGTFDHVNGGFVVFKVENAPAPVRGDLLPYVPGLASALWPVTRAAFEGDLSRRDRQLVRLERELPGVGAVVSLKAQSLRASGNYAAALAAYRRLIARGGIYEDTWFGAAICALNLGMYEEALADARHALHTSPEWQRDISLAIGHASNNLAVQISRDPRKIVAATALANQAIGADPLQSAYWSTLGRLQAKSGHGDAAAASFGRALELARSAAERDAVLLDMRQKPESSAVPGSPR